LPRHQAVIVEYTSDPTKDMYQVVLHFRYLLSRVYFKKFLFCLNYSDWQIFRGTHRLCGCRYCAGEFKQVVGESDVFLPKQWWSSHGSWQSGTEHHQSLRLSSSSRKRQSTCQSLCLRCWIRFVSQHFSRRKE
jgi:hypothetical protein